MLKTTTYSYIFFELFFDQEYADYENVFCNNEQQQINCYPKPGYLPILYLYNSSCQEPNKDWLFTVCESHRRDQKALFANRIASRLHSENRILGTTCGLSDYLENVSLEQKNFILYFFLIFSQKITSHWICYSKTPLYVHT